MAEWRPFVAGAARATGSRLLRNAGVAAAGYFEDVTVAAGLDLEALLPPLLLREAFRYPYPVPGREAEDEGHAWDEALVDTVSNGVYTFSPAFVDLDGDSWQDLAITGDFGTSILFFNRGDGRGFSTESSKAAGAGKEENGMGAAFADVDCDGHLDWFVTGIYDERPRDYHTAFGNSGNRLYRWAGARGGGDARAFDDWSDGVRDAAWGWGAAFLDANLDGAPDLFVVNGYTLPESTQEDPFNLTPNRLFLQRDGPCLRGEGEGAPPAATPAAAPAAAPTAVRWEGVGGQAVASKLEGRAAVSLDFDQDGALDLFVANYGKPPTLLRGQAADDPGARWLQVRVCEPAMAGASQLCGRHSIGAVVRLRSTSSGIDQTIEQTRVIGVGEHFLGHSALIAHFGLGSSGSGSGSSSRGSSSSSGGSSGSGGGGGSSSNGDGSSSAAGSAAGTLPVWTVEVRWPPPHAHMGPMSIELRHPNRLLEVRRPASDAEALAHARCDLDGRVHAPGGAYDGPPGGAEAASEARASEASDAAEPAVCALVQSRQLPGSKRHVPPIALAASSAARAPLVGLAATAEAATAAEAAREAGERAAEAAQAAEALREQAQVAARHAQLTALAATRAAEDAARKAEAAREAARTGREGQADETGREGQADGLVRIAVTGSAAAAARAGVGAGVGVGVGGATAAAAGGVADPSIRMHQHKPGPAANGGLPPLATAAASPPAARTVLGRLIGELLAADEAHPAAAREVRTPDGHGNNVEHPRWGAALHTHRRIAPAAYGPAAHDVNSARMSVDGATNATRDRPAGGQRPSARQVSNTICDESRAPSPDSTRPASGRPQTATVNTLFMLFGQLLSHDVAHTTALPGADAAEALPIVVPRGDPHYDPDGDGHSLRARQKRNEHGGRLRPPQKGQQTHKHARD